MSLMSSSHSGWPQDLSQEHRKSCAEGSSSIHGRLANQRQALDLSIDLRPYHLSLTRTSDPHLQSDARSCTSVKDWDTLQHRDSYGQKRYAEQSSRQNNLAHFSSTNAREGFLRESPITSETRQANVSYNSMEEGTARGYLGIRQFPEGPFHVYEGDHRIPTHVDGESVNPAWGLTKSDKARKRLAVACLECRLRKTKCEPTMKGCLQCEKAQRLCRRYVPGCYHAMSSDEV